MSGLVKPCGHEVLNAEWSTSVDLRPDRHQYVAQRI